MRCSFLKTEIQWSKKRLPTGYLFRRDYVCIGSSKGLSGIEAHMPEVVKSSLNQTLLVSFLSFFYYPHFLIYASWITSQINSLQSSPCLRNCFWRNPNSDFLKLQIWNAIYFSFTSWFLDSCPELYKSV